MIASHDAFELDLGDSPLCAPGHDEEQTRNLSHVIFACPDFNNPGASLLLRLRVPFGVPLVDTVNILCSITPRVVFLNFVRFIISASFFSLTFNIV